MVCDVLRFSHGDGWEGKLATLGELSGCVAALEYISNFRRRERYFPWNLKHFINISHWSWVPLHGRDQIVPDHFSQKTRRSIQTSNWGLWAQAAGRSHGGTFPGHPSQGLISCLGGDCSCPGPRCLLLCELTGGKSINLSEDLGFDLDRWLWEFISPESQSINFWKKPNNSSIFWGCKEYQIWSFPQWCFVSYSLVDAKATLTSLISSTGLSFKQRGACQGLCVIISF